MRKRLQEMRNESQKKKNQTISVCSCGDESRRINILRSVFPPCFSLVVTLLSALIGSDVDLKERRAVTARRDMHSSPRCRRRGFHRVNYYESCRVSNVIHIQKRPICVR